MTVLIEVKQDGMGIITCDYFIVRLLETGSPGELQLLAFILAQSHTIKAVTKSRIQLMYLVKEFNQP